MLTVYGPGSICSEAYSDALGQCEPTISFPGSRVPSRDVLPASKLIPRGLIRSRKNDPARLFSRAGLL
ncbi:MAG: hypothetical protein IJR97_02195 [Clostridia bacterium]|nr:hypothetical protein [Clostridia bacterium]